MRYRWTPGLAQVVDDDRVVVAVLPGGPPVVLAGTGVDIWLHVNGASTEQISTELAAVYDADPGQISADVAAYCATLEGFGFLRPDEPPI